MIIGIFGNPTQVQVAAIPTRVPAFKNLAQHFPLFYFTVYSV